MPIRKGLPMEKQAISNWAYSAGCENNPRLPALRRHRTLWTGIRQRGVCRITRMASMAGGIMKPKGAPAEDTPQSDESTGDLDGAPGSSENVDRIREILFGSQMREY